MWQHMQVTYIYDNAILNWEGCVEISTKGQVNSEWIFEVIVSSKIPTKNYKDFWPLAMKCQRQIGFQDVQNAKFW